jgi:type II secretory pathway pseudopilin PulG
MCYIIYEVVIAIIALLSSVVLASLNVARSKGADGAIKANLSNARSQAELFYNAALTYDAVCTAGTNNISPQILGAARNLGATAVVGADGQAFAYNTVGSTAGAAVCHDTAAGWAAIVSLKVPNTASAGWCVDSTGIAKESTSLAANAVVCP